MASITDFAKKVPDGFVSDETRCTLERFTKVTRAAVVEPLLAAAVTGCEHAFVQPGSIAAMGGHHA